jgi:hypothetical protein
LNRIQRPEYRDPPVAPLKKIRGGNTAYFLYGQEKGHQVIVLFNVKHQDALNPAYPGCINIFAFKIQEAAENAQGPPGKHGLKSFILPFRVTMGIPGVLSNNTITGEACLMDSPYNINNT